MARQRFDGHLTGSQLAVCRVTRTTLPVCKGSPPQPEGWEPTAGPRFGDAELVSLRGVRSSHPLATAISAPFPRDQRE